ncbi:MAG: hypothetical protein ABIH21_03420 [Patescibacteria group bacterium]
MKKVFVASSRKYYDQVKEIKEKLDELGVKGFYPYFDFHDDQVESDEETKKQLTLGHFPEIDEVEVLYAVTPDGYVGCSVTIEATYAYAKGKEVITSEPASELAVRAMVTSAMTPDEFIAYVSGGK